MRFLRTFLLLVVLLGAEFLFLPSGARAQSPFALTNIGQPIDSADSRMIGRGGWGMAERDSLNPGFLNQASIAAINKVAIKFTAFGEQAASDDEHGSRTTDRTLIPGFEIGLPVIKGRLAFTSGITVGRSMEYRTLIPRTWYAWDDTLTGQEQFNREGTLWQVPIGLSWQIRPGVSVGGSVGLVSGSIRESVNNFFIQPAGLNGLPLYLANGRVQKDEFTGQQTTWSLRLGTDRGPALGFRWTPAHHLDVDRKLSVGGLAARAVSEWTMEMPDAFRAGFQAPLSGRWRVGGDAALQSFSNFRGRPEWEADMVDEYLIGVGVERRVSFARHGGKGNLPLRCGFQYRRWPYQVGGTEVGEKTFSVGTGFPFRGKAGMLDIGLSYSMIGDQSRNGMQSRVWRLSISATALEKWW